MLDVYIQFSLSTHLCLFITSSQARSNYEAYQEEE